ncbi:hypothetical protein B0T16DRAFT_358868 [Cercophora newfieldiana]|uniref:G-protein coupled receptors family 2 profile 2 domain-containing protein n=1 Tax=Cercophora newfieldiana TaxID=92897 RepID=A0AA39XX84_9PEZI|nr:hypothetical protein B0T16DRAFT_358868 [Cercophora newfieldiana]
MVTPPPDDQVRLLVVLERIGGCLSLCSVIAVFIFFALLPRLRTVPNTFLVFASIANTFSAIAAIIAYDGIRQGQTSPLCQLQGFLFEMFGQSDAWWSLAIAINVLSIFFHDAHLHSLRKWGWLYCLVCYGGPFGIALMCLLVTEPGKSLIYGSAGNWCWISEDWSALRIYTCYMIVWGCLLTSLIIYATIAVRASRTHDEPRHEGASHSRQSSFPSSPGMTAFLISATPNRSPSPSVYNPSVHEALDRPPLDDPLKRAYLRTGVFFTLSVLITWTLTSVHRVHELLYSESPFAFSVVTAIVVPLQGTMTAAVFFSTSWTTLRDGVADLVVTPTQKRARPARQGKSVYSMWRDASPSSNPSSNRRDSWDFLDIGIEDQSARGVV